MTLIAKGYIEKLKAHNESLIEQVEQLTEELRSLKLLLKTYHEAKKHRRRQETTSAILLKGDRTP